MVPARGPNEKHDARARLIAIGACSVLLGEGSGRRRERPGGGLV